VPNYIDVRTCTSYVHLYEQYSELIEEMEKVKKQMEDVKVKIGNDIMNMTRAYFHNARFASQSGVSNAAPIYEKLKTNYAVGRNSKKKIAY
jgi:S-adenosylmethionine/arginine decarboxylase-like enzyme